MNTGLPEMLHCLNSKLENCEMSVLERQRSILKWQQEQQLDQHPPITYFNGNDQLTYLASNNDQGLCEVVNAAMKPDPGVENDNFQRLLDYGNCPDSEMSSALPRTVSCPPNVAANIVKESCKKRKADKTHNLKIAAEEKIEEKRMKECAAAESKMTEQNSNSKSSTTTLSTSANKNNKGPNKSSKAADAPRTDYIHVRARRGQATDSHSLAERVRREKISERMKYLQDLVPGCNKVTGKAGMLDEIINYVQSLQRQVEFLSMKLAVINPRLDFDIENHLIKEIFPSSVPTVGASSSTMVDHCHLQFNPPAQGVSGSGLEMAVDPMDATVRRTISAPVSIPQTFLDSSSLNQIQHMTWEDELQNLYSMEYQQGRSTSFISQQIAGLLEANHVKLEM